MTHLLTTYILLLAAWLVFGLCGCANTAKQDAETSAEYIKQQNISATNQPMPMNYNDVLAPEVSGFIPRVAPPKQVQGNRKLTLVCDPDPGAVGYEFEQGMDSGSYTNGIYEDVPQGTFTNLPPKGRMFFVCAAINDLGLISPQSPEITFSSWGTIVTISSPVTNRAQATPSLMPALWAGISLPVVATNPPGTLFVRGLGVMVDAARYANP